MRLERQIIKASSAANGVIDDYKIKSRIQEGYTRVDPDFIAQKAGVTVLYKPLERLLGGYLNVDGKHGIIVNIERPRGLVHMTCGHELGHYFLEHSSTYDEKILHSENAQITERAADQFAYSLLAPRWLIAMQMRDHQWSIDDLKNVFIVYQISLRLGISYTAMVWSLRRLNLIPQDIATRLAEIKPKEIKSRLLNDSHLDLKNSDVWVLDSSDKEKIIEPGINDRFLIKLPNHASSGHLWGLDETSSEGFHIEPVTIKATDKKKIDRKSIVIGNQKAEMEYILKSKINTHEDFINDRFSIREEIKKINLAESKPWATDDLILNQTSFNAKYEVQRQGLSNIELKSRLNHAD